MDITFHLCDAEGNKIPQQFCECGNEADTFIQGIHKTSWICNGCLYGNVPVGELIYKQPLESEYGGTGFRCALSDKQKEKLK